MTTAIAIKYNHENAKYIGTLCSSVGASFYPEKNYHNTDIVKDTLRWKVVARYLYNIIIFYSIL